MKAVGTVLLFIFALLVFGFVAYVWQTADDDHRGPPPSFAPTTVQTPPVPSAP